MGLNFFEKLTDEQLFQVYKIEQNKSKNVNHGLQNPLFQEAIDYYDRMVDTPNKLALDQLYYEVAKRWANSQQILEMEKLDKKLENLEKTLSENLQEKEDFTNYDN